MALNLLGLIPKVLKTVASIVGGGAKLEDVANALAGNTLPPEQRLALENAMMAHEAEMQRLNIEEMKAAMSESLAMIASDDKFVKRARPFGLYAFYVATLALVGATIAGVNVDSTAILTLLAPLAGVGGTYVYKRTQEKLNGNGH